MKAYRKNGNGIVRGRIKNLEVVELLNNIHVSLDYVVDFHATILFFSCSNDL